MAIVKVQYFTSQLFIFLITNLSVKSNDGNNYWYKSNDSTFYNKNLYEQYNYCSKRHPQK